MSLLTRVWELLIPRSGASEVASLLRRVAPGQMFGDLQLKQCRHGPMLFSGPVIGKSFELYGEYSESELDVMRKFVSPGDTVVDIGANIGDLTVPLAELVGPEGLVIACESHAEIFNVLCANLALNGLKQVRPMNAFIQQRRDALTADAESPYISRRFAPPPMALDDLGLESCRLIKVDVDGAEENILRSGEALLRRTRPVLYVENDTQETSAGLLRYLDSLGYDLYRHAAPVYSADNFYGNPDNVWEANLLSPMVLAIPREGGITVANLPRVHDPDEWWDFSAAWIREQAMPGFTVQLRVPEAG